jgi:hypothetical protein
MCVLGMKTISLTQNEYNALDAATEQIRAVAESCWTDEYAKELNEIITNIESIKRRSRIYKREPKSRNT